MIELSLAFNLDLLGITLGFDWDTLGTNFGVLLGAF